MLSDAHISPRPLPPARSRRSLSHSRLRSSMDQRPPPPYAALPEKPTLLGSPIGVTTKLMSLAEEGPEAAQTWMQEKSKKELEELLQKAGSLIKDREQGMLHLSCNFNYDLHHARARQDGGGLQATVVK